MPVTSTENSGTRPSKWRRRAAYICLGISVLLAVGLVVLRVRYNGSALAQTVQDALQGNIRGTVKVRRIDWPLRDLPKLLFGGWLEVKISDLEVFDEYGTNVISTPGGTLEIDVHAAISGKHYLLRNVVLSDGGNAVIKQVPEPYPAHDYDYNVVSLVSAFYPQRAPSFNSGYTPRRRPSIELRGFEVKGAGVTLEFQFSDFSAKVHHVTGGGFLFYGGNDPLGHKLYYSLATIDGPKGGTQAKSADLFIEDKKIVLRDIKLNKLAQLPSRWPSELVPRDLEYAATATGPGGLKVTLDGAILDSWIDIFGGDHRLSLELERAGKVTELLSDGRASGEDLYVQLDIDGPALAPRLKAELRNLDLNIPIGANRPALRLRIDKAVPSWDLATESGAMHEVTATGGGGRMELAASFQLNPLHFDLDINIPVPIDLGPYLPDTVAPLSLGTRLSGKLAAVGDRNKQHLQKLDLRFGKAQISGQAFREGQRIVASGARIDLLGTSLRDIHGEIDPGTQKINLDFKLRSTDTARWMRHFNTQPLLRGLSGRVSVKGTIGDPKATANLVATGIPMFDRMDLSLDYSKRALRIDNAESSSLGGWLRASGSILFDDSTRLRDLDAQGVNLKLNKIPLIGSFLEGELDLKLEGQGTTKRPELKVQAKLSNWSLAGESYDDTTIVLDTKKDGDKQIKGTLTRKRGGVLHVAALLDRASQLEGIVTLRDLPLDSLLAHTSGQPPDAGGALSAELQLSGSSKAPALQGQVTLLRSWVRRAFLGTADFQIEKVGPGTIRIQGHVLQRRLLLDCTLSTTAPYALAATLKLHRIELDRFTPTLSEDLGIRGWISGTLDYKANLDGTGSSELSATLTEAEIVASNDDKNGRPAPIRLRNRTPIRLHYDGERLSVLEKVISVGPTGLKVLEKAIIHGPTGDFTLAGSGTKEQLDFRLDGSISVQLLRPYLENWVDEIDGHVVAQATIAGPISKPQIVGVLELEDVYIKPAGQDAIMTIPSGKIDFSNSQLSVTGLRLVVNDEFSDDVSELTVGGGIRLTQFQPNFWAMRIEGKLAGKMLQVVAPKVFSAASGSAAISVALLGPGTSPGIDGTIEFGSDNPLSLTPRAARREISFTSGLVRFTDKDIELEKIQAVVDGEGLVTDLNGDISLEDWQPVDVDISISARDLLFRIPQELELSVNLNNVEVVGGVDGLEIVGPIEVSDGRYIRKFNPVLAALQPTRSTETQTSVFESVPLLGNAELKIALSTRAFFVDNNVAQLELNGDVDINGTPLRPDFDGVIHVAQGNFKFQGVRARFERTTGSVRFTPGLTFPDESPYLSIESESDYRSTDGQNHLVSLRLQGPLSKLDVDLSTGAGLNKTQTIQLIFSGRTPEDVRESLLGDEAVSRRGGEFDNQSTVRSDNSFQALDEFTKDIASDVFALIIGDRLRAATKLDVANLQIGTASIGFKGEKFVTRSWKFIGEIERSISGWNWDLQTEYRLSDGASLDLGYLERYFDDEADQDESQVRVRGTWRGYLIP